MREVWVTGIGLVSSLGEGREAHLAAMGTGFAEGARPVVDEVLFAPFPVHPSPALELDRQIPKKGDQRQMEPWQRLGTYAAGLALDDAGARGLVADMDLVVAAGGGERDLPLDESVLEALAATPAGERERRLNELLTAGLRPTLFLAQLSNLLAGNISIVHGVTGASRTLMGEEQAGADALRVAHARVAEGRNEVALVGGAFIAPRWDLLLLYRAGGLLRGGAPWAPVWSRGDAPGAICGTVAAFLVLEAAEGARARGAKGLARLSGIACDQARRAPGDDSLDAARRAFARLAPAPGPLPVISGATGVAAPVGAERSFLDGLAGQGFVPLVRATGSRIGWGVEAAFPANVALAALALSAGRLPAPMEAAEAPFDGPPARALVTGFGAWRGESLALLERLEEGAA
ncbi:MAG TPA: beta-ketoacyl-ACP synthase [Acetobacteraceae bacterium]|jgi:3-oxoacyl-[acyl-carrier-protein] synthase II|nr:beta-ketoacyl-ACP synthase [Acetobacteraceae bacterium]